MSENPDKPITTIRLRRDIRDALDAETVKMGWNSRTLLIEQIAAKFLQERGHKIDVRVAL
jgi:hypothetical protein